MRSAALILLLLLLALSLALRGASAIPASKRLQPGQLWEVNVNMTAGQRAAWNISVDAGTIEIYDIHSHAPGNVSDVTRYAGGLLNRTASGTFTAPADNLYSWFVENGIGEVAFTATIDVDLLPPEAKTPLPALPWAALAVLLAALAQRR
ncbi:MAG: hypothetical protein LC624_01595 [Halobacteriales archaeon]|nr:hypothetical protein [Halobacteriales archaeon]